MTYSVATFATGYWFMSCGKDNMGHYCVVRAIDIILWDLLLWLVYMNTTFNNETELLWYLIHEFLRGSLRVFTACENPWTHLEEMLRGKKVCPVLAGESMSFWAHTLERSSIDILTF